MCPPPEITDVEGQAFTNMILVAEKSGMMSLKALSQLKSGKTEQPVKKASKPVKASKDGVSPWFNVVNPHMDIRQGRLDESVFAANLSEVALGSGREIYQNPALFFEKPISQLDYDRSKGVIGGLNGSSAENRVISLQTGFGGGKTPP